MSSSVIPHQKNNQKKQQKDQVIKTHYSDLIG